jgi:probable F420-dependent oxidoreductase
MRFWQSLAFDDPAELAALARGAEDAGFEGVMLSEHLFVPEEYAANYPYSPSGRPDFGPDTPFPDPWVTIAALAAATRRLRFVTMIHILPLHHPIEMAKTIGTAARFSQDRVILGAGAGWMREEFDALGVDFETRGRRFDESIEILRLLWSGEMVEYHGESFDFARIKMSPAPDRPIPIYIGGASRPALRRAARCGDGWLGAGNTPEEAAAILGELRRLRAEAGRADEPFEAVVPLTASFEADTLRRLSELGATATVHYPFVYSVGPEATLTQKLDAMKRFGDGVIGPLQAA